jgi:hypothetical protein
VKISGRERMEQRLSLQKKEFAGGKGGFEG